MRRASVLVVALAAILPSAARAYSLADYLGDVETGNPALAAAVENQSAFGAKAGEMDVMYSPFLSGTVNWIDDRKEPSTSFSPERTLASQWNVGLGQRFRTGTTVAIGYGMNYTRLFSQPAQPMPASMAAFAPLLQAMSSAFLPLPSWDARASVTVSQSIWKDIVLGVGDAANAKVKAQAGAGTLGERYRAAAIRFQAEEVYWRLGLMRRVVAAKRESLERTRKMEAWASRRVEMNLGDRSDLLQARAGVRFREVDLRGAEQDALAAARTFNSLRGREGDEVPGELDDLPVAVASLPPAAPAPAGDRLDVQATAEMLRAAELGLVEARARTAPDFSVFGSAAFNGRDPAMGGAASEGFTVDYPTWMAGAVLTVPLGFPRISKARKGYEADVRSAGAALARAKLDAARDWRELAARWADTTERLALAADLETLQREKAVREQERYSLGRTTMYQVLAFEDDLSTAQLLSLRVGYEKLVLSAQARLYGTR